MKKIFIFLILILLLTGCEKNMTADGKKLLIKKGLAYEGEYVPEYAGLFKIDCFEGDVRLVTVYEDGKNKTVNAQYLVLPEGFDTFSDEDIQEISKTVTVINEPKGGIYLVASSVMDMFISMDSLDLLSYSALMEKDWYLEEARDEMQNGNIVYAGKYSAPDYELLLSGGGKPCSLAIENTMIYHNPKVKEELNRFGIPVFVDYSSYEETALARMEWVKLYGALTGRQQAAEEAFLKSKKGFEGLDKNAGTSYDKKPKIAFFYLTKSGLANVRKSDDYIPEIFHMAGAEYVFSDLRDERNMSTVNLQLEEFYEKAKDADYVIYNSTIEGELSGISDFKELNPLFSNMKAVKENRVFCTAKSLYQSTMELGDFAADVDLMLSGKYDEMHFLFQLK